jgi:hypothetical protein
MLNDYDSWQEELIKLVNEESVWVIAVLSRGAKIRRPVFERQRH